MGKTSKRKMQWRSLEMDINTESKSNKDPSTVKPHSEVLVHPFLKPISKNMDAIVKKDSTQPSDDSKLVYLYRSYEKVGVGNPNDLGQYAGKPIQYKPAQKPQNSSTIHYSFQQQQQHQPIYYQPYPTYTPPIHTPPFPSHSQDLFIPKLPSPTPYGPQQVPYPMPMYYAIHPTNQQIQIPPPQYFSTYQPPLHSSDLPHPLQVEYIPYYYYYPVPAPNPTPPENNSSVSIKRQSSLTKQNNTRSTKSCDSCPGQNKVRRRKKKKSVEEFKEVDSGYLDGDESSSEVNSDEEQDCKNTSSEQTDLIVNSDGQTEDKKEKEKEITNMLIKQIRNPTIDFQFGEVQEILDELNNTNNLKNREENEESVIPQIGSDTIVDTNQTSTDIDSEKSLSLASPSKIIQTVQCTVEEPLNKETVISELDTLDSASKQVSAVESLTFSNKKEKTISEKESTTTESRNGQCEKKIMSSKGKETRENKRNITFSDNPAEKIISKPKDEPLLVEKSNEASNMWTTVSNSRKNKYINNKLVLQDNYEVFNDNQDLTKEQIEENLFLYQEETESENDSTPIKELCLIPKENTVEKIKIESLNKCKKRPSKKDKKKKIPTRILNQNLEENEISSMTSDTSGKCKNISEPLDDMKALLYEEKTVEIINLPSQDMSKKVPSRMQKNKNKTTNVPKTHQSPKLEDNKDKSLNDNENLMADLIDMNFPILFFHPFSNFEDQLLQDHSSQLDLANNFQPIQYNEDDKIHFSPHSMTFLDPTFSSHMISDYSHLIVGGKTGLATTKDDFALDNLEQVEAELIDMNILKHHHTHSYLRNGKDKLIMFRPHNINQEIKSKPTRKSPVKKTEVPGPRVKYNHVLRSGPLGVRRQVVPPQCLATRYTRI